MSWMILFEKGIWFGFAALGFGILFNVPSRTLFSIFITGILGGLMKSFLVWLGLHVIISSLGGATLIGIISIYVSHVDHAPPLVFAIPSVIPMVPGVFAYRMMLGVMKLTVTPDEHYQEILAGTINNALNATFILLSLAVGVTLPLLLARRDSVKNLKL